MSFSRIAASHLTPLLARILLCAILSDTLNLKSATTAKADDFAVALLTKLGEVEDEKAVSLLQSSVVTGYTSSSPHQSAAYSSSFAQLSPLLLNNNLPPRTIPPLQPQRPVSAT